MEPESTPYGPESTPCGPEFPPIRARFEEMNADLFRRCMEPVEKVLRDAKMDKSQVFSLFPSHKSAPYTTTYTRYDCAVTWQTVTWQTVTWQTVTWQTVTWQTVT
jgi:hypothetical protein